MSETSETQFCTDVRPPCLREASAKRGGAVGGGF